jgi:hypothetical protein
LWSSPKTRFHCAVSGRECAAALLSLQTVLPLTSVLAASSEAEPPFTAPADASAPRMAVARLLTALRSKILIEPVVLHGDPYIARQAGNPPAAPLGSVCGVRFEPDQVHYRLSTFADSAAARAGGFAVTHLGACGTCSTLQDLAVYLEKPDLTAPVRKCAFKWSAQASLTCLEHLGFSTACAQTWLYDAENTRRECLSHCLWSWITGEAPTRSDGQLNACLQCDEDRSGPVFKVTAGRTRRNSGIHSSIPRANDEIAPLVHDYVPGVAPPN